MDQPLAQLESLLLVTAAAFLAGFLGLEREAANKPAGFRTHMIIGGASALLVILARTLVMQYDQSSVADHLRTDPLRVFEAIIVGISFIGAGTILKSQSGDRIRYLTTAASILFSASIGIAVALKQFVLAVGVTILVLIITFALHKVGDVFGKPSSPDGSADS